MDFQETLSFIFWGNTIENYLWFTGIVLLAILFKRLLSKRLGKLLFGLFKRVKPGLLEFDDLFNLMIKPMELLIVLIGLSFAVGVLDLPGSEEGAGISRMIDVALQISIVVAVTWSMLRLMDFLGLILLKQAEKTASKTDDQIILFVKEAGKIFVYIFSFLFILGAVFKLNIGAMVAGLGIGGLAIALAAQDTLENVIASFIIFFDKPFIVGDYIKVSGVSGVVEKIGFRSSRIRTLEKSYLTIPNKMLISDVLDNMSLRTFRRAKFHVGLVYETSIEQVKAIVNDIQAFVDEHENTNQDGLIRFEEFGDSSLNVMVLFYVDTTEYNIYLAVVEEINFKIMEIVKKHGSDFAFPSTTVYLQKEN
ncbi:MAG TPA: mechanosensitive ion channel family protein [Flavobacteriales bacterium]|nr:mechanosensitive ion channel family protein [Flavobacteriales bacterium]